MRISMDKLSDSDRSLQRANSQDTSFSDYERGHVLQMSRVFGNQMQSGGIRPSFQNSLENVCEKDILYKDPQQQEPELVLKTKAVDNCRMQRSLKVKINPPYPKRQKKLDRTKGIKRPRDVESGSIEVKPNMRGNVVASWEAKVYLYPAYRVKRSGKTKTTEERAPECDIKIKLPSKLQATIFIQGERCRLGTR